MKIPETASQSAEEDSRMFITVKYGNDESILCNPSCAIVNLLANIKRRTGFGNTDMMLDLSDESGTFKKFIICTLMRSQCSVSYHTKYI